MKEKDEKLIGIGDTSLIDDFNSPISNEEFETIFKSADENSLETFKKAVLSMGV